jgi:hypothetical protein
MSLFSLNEQTWRADGVRGGQASVVRNGQNLSKPDEVLAKQR